MLVDIHAHYSSALPASRLSQYAGLTGLDLVLVSNRDAASDGEGACNLDEAAANLATLQHCQTYPRLAALYRIRPGRVDSNVHAMVGALATEPFFGVVLAPGEQGFDLADELLDSYLTALLPSRHPVVVCIANDERGTPEKAYALGRRHRRLPLVLCAAGADEQRSAGILNVVRDAAQRGDANLLLDTSHRSGDAVRRAIDTVGAERVLFGSDALSYQDAHVPRHIALLDELRKSLAPETFRLVMGENATRVFRLRPAGA